MNSFGFTGPMKHLCLCILLVGVSAVAAGQAAVEGTVRDREGRPLPAVSLTLERADARITQQTTGPAGDFYLGALDSGAYTLRAEAPGFYPATYNSVLRSRETISLSIELLPAAPVEQAIAVSARPLALDPGKTGSSYTFTHQGLENLPDPLIDSTSSLVENLMPGASDSHDNLVAVRGTEFSLHEFINGVSFLDNTQPQFSPGISPQIFETVDLMTGGFTAEYGNRFGGVLDIATRSGTDRAGHGDLNFRGATLDNYDLNAEYGGKYRGLGYYVYADGFTSARFLDPPEPNELYDFGRGSRFAAQLDWHAGANDSFKLLLMGGGDNFQHPNLIEDQAVGRNAQR